MKLICAWPGRDERSYKKMKMKRGEGRRGEITEKWRVVKALLIT